jgi:hypothetical protein
MGYEKDNQGHVNVNGMNNIKIKPSYQSINRTTPFLPFFSRKIGIFARKTAVFAMKTRSLPGALRSSTEAPHKALFVLR